MLPGIRSLPLGQSLWDEDTNLGTSTWGAESMQGDQLPYLDHLGRPPFLLFALKKKKNSCLTPSPFPPLLRRRLVRVLPCWRLSPWETMPGVWPVVGLEVGKALNTQLSTSFPRPTLTSRVTMGEGQSSRLHVPSRGGEPWQGRLRKTPGLGASLGQMGP